MAAGLLCSCSELWLGAGGFDRIYTSRLTSERQISICAESLAIPALLPYVTYCSKGCASSSTAVNDSAGIAVETNDKISIVRRVGKVEELSNAVEDWDVTSTCGIGHTRWATHGRPTEQNAHPHSDCSGKVAVVHNGIIENFVQLRGLLESEGHVFRSETDTEIVAHLIEKYYKGDLIEALARTTDDLQGAYGLAVMHVDHPGEIAVTRKDSRSSSGFPKGTSRPPSWRATSSP